MTPRSNPFEAIERELGLPAPALPSGALFHYTTADATLEILKVGAIWATDFRYLNDYDELRRGERIATELVAARLAGATGFDREVLSTFSSGHRVDCETDGYAVFVASFSASGNLLSQWRAYGANGAGYSLGFSGLGPAVGSLAGQEPFTVELGQCVYDDDVFRSRIGCRFDRILKLANRFERERIAHADQVLLAASAHLARAAASTMPYLKHPAFREEDEWRLVAVPRPQREHEAVRYRGTARGVVPYIPVPLCDQDKNELLALRRVYVGPTHDPEAGLDTIRSLLCGLGYVGELAMASGIPYRG